MQTLLRLALYFDFERMHINGADYIKDVKARFSGEKLCVLCRQA